MTRPTLLAVATLALSIGCVREALSMATRILWWPRTEAPHAPPPASQPEPSAHDALDRLDTRAPVPPLPMMANHQKQNMRDHLVAVQEITAALATDDFPAIERAAGRIGFSEQMGQAA
jgi:hypothetical protein